VGQAVRDYLWKEAGWSWALWSLRGDFGVLDSSRAEVAYEVYKGHKLDRRMLELLRSS
jgi:endoglucanase